jgi:ABC-type branched-subunit amino acid transport system permease subunit
MNDPVAAPGRWACLAALTAIVVLRASAGPIVVRIAVLALAGLSVLPVLGWLRTLWFTPAAAAGLAAWTTATVLQTGQAVPVALVAATLVGGVVGGTVALVTQRVHLGARPWVSLLFTAAVWALVLPRLNGGPTLPPLLFGVDLAGERSLAVVALALLACGMWGIGNLARTRAGRQIGAAGSSPTLALRSGAAPAAVWLRTGAISGVLAGWAGLVLALASPSGPGVGQFSPATALTWLAVPLLGGPAWVSGVLVGAVVVGGAAAVVPFSETALAGIALALAALTRGGGLVGAITQRLGRP